MLVVLFLSQFGARGCDASGPSSANLPLLTATASASQCTTIGSKAQAALITAAVTRVAASAATPAAAPTADNVTSVTASQDGDARSALLAAELELTVVWPDSCGSLIDSGTNATVVGSHIVVDMAGHQVGDACAEVISPQSVVLEFDGLSPGDYSVVGVLHETLRDGTEVPTLTNIIVSRSRLHST